MIFRDVKTGALLNIRHDDYINDRLYYMDIMKHCTPIHHNGSVGGGLGGIGGIGGIGGLGGSMSSMLFPHGGNEYNIPSWMHSAILPSNNNNA
jgi:hypothetical protein